MPVVISNGDIPDIIIIDGQDVEKVANDKGELLWLKNVSPEKWQFNENISNSIGSPFEENISFTADSIIFNSIKVVTKNNSSALMFDDITAYDVANNTWSSVDYRTISFSTAPLGKIRKWLKLNATLL